MTTPTPPAAAGGLPPENAPKESHTASLWAGLLGAPALWSLHLVLAYALVTVVGRHPSLHWILHLTAAVFLLLILSCGLICYLEYRRAGLQWPSPTSTPIPLARTRFLAALGILSSLLFSLALIAQSLAAFFLNPRWT